MVAITALLLPIALSAVLVFVLAALAWMVAPHHKGEWQEIGAEEGVRAALRASKPAPGLYGIPFAGTSQARGEPAFLKKLEDGPVAFITIRAPGNVSMGPMMIQSIVYYLVVGTIVAYVAGHVLPAGATYLQVFRVVGTTAWLAYGFGSVPDSIWFARPWSSTIKQVLDALVFALVTAGTFGWLWPR